MPKTIYFTAATIDGYIADNNDSLEWLFKNGPADTSFIGDFLETIGAIAMGASTYQWILDHIKNDPWPYQVPTLVFTHRQFPVINGADIRFVQGDVREKHKQLQKLAGDKNIWLTGGGDLVGQFHDHGLLDEMHIQTVAVFLNEGKKLFNRKTDTAFKIKNIIPRGETCVEVIYQVR